MPSTDKRQDTLVKAIGAFLTGDVGVCEDVFTRDVVWSSPFMTTSSRDELETRLSSRADALTDIELSIVHLVADADVAVAEWTVAANHARPFVVPGDTRLDPGGERMVLGGVTVANFQGTRISAIRHYFDKVTLLEQLLGD
jgi:limonene-1,2-epoxide hydrolase